LKIRAGTALRLIVRNQSTDNYGTLDMPVMRGPRQ
jgi:hypothetical protein